MIDGIRSQEVNNLAYLKTAYGEKANNHFGSVIDLLYCGK